MSLYKFKSRACADLIMLEPNGRQLLTILGKEDAASLRQGILLPEHMPAAARALRAAIAHEEAQRAQQIEEAQAAGQPAPRFDGVSLRQRCTPFLDMLARAQTEEKEIVWGV